MAEPTLTAPPMPKPEAKMEILAWLDNLERQIQATMGMVEPESLALSSLTVEMKIVAQIETMVNVLP
jgi:hypothetical protein